MMVNQLVIEKKIDTKLFLTIAGVQRFTSRLYVWRPEFKNKLMNIFTQKKSIYKSVGMCIRVVFQYCLQDEPANHKNAKEIFL